MNVFEQAIIQAANLMNPEDPGYQTALEWGEEVVERVAFSETAPPPPRPPRQTRPRLPGEVQPPKSPGAM